MDYFDHNKEKAIPVMPAGVTPVGRGVGKDYCKKLFGEVEGY